MFKKRFFCIFIGVILVFSIAGCMSTLPAFQKIGEDLRPNNNQAVILIKRSHNASHNNNVWDIFIDGKKIGKVANGGETRVLVNNGQRNITVVWESWFRQSSNTISVNANSNVLSFTTSQDVNTTNRLLLVQD